jgi:hypothetical protein
MSIFPPTTDRYQEARSSWAEIVDLARARSKPFNEVFREAIEALSRSFKAGYLTEDEVDQILRLLVAIAVEKEMETRLGAKMIGQPAASPATTFVRSFSQMHNDNLYRFK